MFLEQMKKVQVEHYLNQIEKELDDYYARIKFLERKKDEAEGRLQWLKENNHE